MPIAAACALLSLTAALLTPTSLHAAPGRQSTGALVYQGGPVMHKPTVYSVFWLPSGDSFQPPDASSTDKDYEDTNLSFLSDVSGSSLAGILTQYSDKKGPASDQIVYGGAWVDTRAYPHNRGTVDNPLQDSDVQGEIKRAIKTQGWQVKSNVTMIMVFTAYGIQSCDSGEGSQQGCTFSQTNGYCGYHSFMQYKHANVVYSNLPDLSSDVCNTVDQPITSDNAPNGDAAADIQVNNVSHELFESITDPLAGYKPAWVGAQDSTKEIADLCDQAWGTRDDNGGDVVLNGYDYVVQSEWSNQDGGCVLSVGGDVLTQPSSSD
jgi:hypothetical protein